MRRAKRPSVNTRCVADNYAAPDERIVEFMSAANGGGGLISLRNMPDNTLRVEVYRCDKNVAVNVIASCESMHKKPDPTAELAESLEQVTCALDTVLLHFAKHMPAADQASRRALVTEAEALLKRVRQ